MFLVGETLLLFGMKIHVRKRRRDISGEVNKFAARSRGRRPIVADWF